MLSKMKNEFELLMVIYDEIVSVYGVAIASLNSEKHRKNLLNYRNGFMEAYKMTSSYLFDDEDKNVGGLYQMKKVYDELYESSKRTLNDLSMVDGFYKQQNFALDRSEFDQAYQFIYADYY